MRSWKVGRGEPEKGKIILESATGRTSREHAILRITNSKGSERYDLEDTSIHGTTRIRGNIREDLQKGERIELEAGDIIEFAGCTKEYSLQELLIAAGHVKDPLDFKEAFRRQVTEWKTYMVFRNNERREQREYRQKKETFERRIKLVFITIILFYVAYLLLTNREELDTVFENPRNYISLIFTIPVFFTRVNGWIVGWFVPKLDHQKVHDDFDEQWRCPNPRCDEKDARSEYRREGGAHKSPEELEKKKKCSKCNAIWTE